MSFRPQGESEGYKVCSDAEAECRISRLWRLTEARSGANPLAKEVTPLLRKFGIPFPGLAGSLEIES